MKRRWAAVVLAGFFFLALTSCVIHSEISKQDYGVLVEAVTFSAEKVIGQYGKQIPPDFSAEKFIQVIQDKIPGEYYQALIKYPLEIKPKGSYYLLLAFNPRNNALILFHYSCVPEPGAILNEPEKYDIHNLDLYDKCKTATP